MDYSDYIVNFKIDKVFNYLHLKCQFKGSYE